MPRNCSTHLLLVHFMVMPMVASVSCCTSQHMSRVLDLKIWKHVSEYFQNPMHWLWLLDMWMPFIINKQFQHISRITINSKYTVIWVGIISVSLVNTNFQVGDFLYNNYKQTLNIITDGEHILPGSYNQFSLLVRTKQSGQMVGEILTTANWEFSGCAHHCVGKPKHREQDQAISRRRECAWSGTAEE